METRLAVHRPGHMAEAVWTSAVRHPGCWRCPGDAYPPGVSAHASITSQSLILGDIECDPARVRGDGGSINPTLVLPLVVKLGPRPVERAVAVTEVWGRAHIDSGSQVPLGEMSRAMSPDDPHGIWMSRPASTSSDHVELRVALLPTHLRVLENARAQDGDVALRVQLRVAAALVRGEQMLQANGGVAVELLPIAWVRTDELRLHVPIGQWAEKVLPGLGADRFRTVIVSLPSSGALTPDKPLVRWFDEARARYDSGDWRGCIERCRDVRHAVESALDATKSAPVGAKAAAGSGLAPRQGVTDFLDGVWRALADVTNEAHHSGDGEPMYRAADARAVLLITATTLEYLAALVGAPAQP